MIHADALLNEGKTKILYAMQGNSEHVLLHFKDDVTAFNGKRVSKIPGKGALTGKISRRLMMELENAEIATHLIAGENFQDGSSDFLVRKCKMIPLEVVVRSIAFGSISKRLGLKEGESLGSIPLVEWYLKNDDLGDPMLNDDHIRFLNFVSMDTLVWFKKMGIEIYNVLSRFFDVSGLILVDFKLEFGLDSSGCWRVCDEISPDTCRLLTKGSMSSLDKDLFRKGRSEEEVMAGYRKVWSMMSAQDAM